MDYSKLTLGDLLGSQDQTIYRNANSILKRLKVNEEKEWKKLGNVLTKVLND